MTSVPRLALGTLDGATDPWPLLRVLLRGFAARKVHVQTFLSRAAFGGFQELRAWSGATPRHLDSWLMTPDQCRSFFLEGTERADLAVVLGQYSAVNTAPPWTGNICPSPLPPQAHHNHTGEKRQADLSRNRPGRMSNSCCLHALSRCSRGAGGNLDALCDWLGLSKLAILSTRQLAQLVANRRSLPVGLEGLFLTEGDPRVPPSQYVVDVGILLGVPLVGIVYHGHPNRLSTVLDKSRCWGDGGLTLWWDFGLFQRIVVASSEKPFPQDPTTIWDFRGRLQVAIARDAVFGCYFQESLELLERAGARIVEFSPLRDERIPPETDVVYLGCGEPREHAARLAENHCLKVSLRDFVRRGGRVYAEGAGAAYLCEWMEVNTGCFISGAGILPAAGRRLPRFGEPLPVTVTLRSSTWLAEAGTAIRGYRNSQWWFEPESVSTGLVKEPGFEYDIIGNAQVVASIVHVDFAAQPALLARFFQRTPVSGSAPSGTTLFVR
ncbi:hypothetical protein [Thermogutta sp.]|uniref:hypothetical protein n=2 Tax=Thermogutta sp. TaxID=1962930 RepID=UPI00321FAE61